MRGLALPPGHGSLPAMSLVLDTALLPASRARFADAVGAAAARRLLATGDVVPLWPGIVVARSTLLDPRTRASAALLLGGDGSALVGPTAAAVHGCAAASGLVVHLGVPYARRVRCREGLVVRQGRGLLDDVAVVDGLPVVPLDAAVADLLCTAPRRDAVALADDALGTVQPDDRAAFLGRVARRLDQRVDRRGTVEAAALLRLVTGAAQSPRESWLKLLVVEAGFPPPVEQHPVVDLDGRVRYLLDLAWPGLRIAVEYDGHEAHEHRATEDATRDEDLRRRGWLVIRVRAADLADPELLLGELHRAFRERGAATSPATGPRATDLRRQRRRARRAGSPW